MRIKQISVSSLFGIFDHVIPLNMDERITIIHSPNGFGKTVMLKMLDGFLNSRYSVFRSIPFSKFKVDFDNQISIEVVNDYNNKDNIKFNFCKPDSEIISFTPKNKRNRIDVNFLVLILDSIIPELDRIDDNRWRYLPTKEIFFLDDVLERFEDLFPTKIKNLLRDAPEWLESLKGYISVRLIESQRSLNFVYSGSSQLPTVSAYSDELAELMQNKFTEYGTLSQSLDRTFPARVVNNQPSPEITEEKLVSQLNELEKTRSRLIEVGLLDKDESTDFKIESQAIDKSTKNMLSVYVKDMKKKLDVFSDIGSKIELFRRIINKKFACSYKKISFSKEKGFVFTTCYDTSSVSEQKTLAPTDLSSGEQHELILLYELLFKVEPKTLVLIDEPELSLHIGWQVEFIKDLQEITELADLDILMATHSPNIIQDRWDLTVELKGLVPLRGIKN
ncbi:MAG: AAA family ATPase [Symploca sp. SIO2G7]|nr:AAA family ATPase [Symploca sp. SIO2G7]